MRYGVTINIPEFNSMRFDSNEYETLEECLEEIIQCLERFDSISNVMIWKNLLESKLKEASN